MERRRSVAFVTILAVLTVVAVATQLTIAPSPAQMAAPKMTGQISDKIVKSFDGMGLPGIHSIQYRHFVMGPGAKIEGDINLSDDHQELCTPVRGTITVTFPDGSKHSFKKGDIFTVPLNTKAKLVTVDASVGFDEFYWSINIKERKNM
jgi:quercetin dioxygenase-like cupin family protein